MTKRILITGANGGIGRATIAALRERGASVMGLDVEAADGVVAADLRDVESVERAVAQAILALGGLDVLVNNAGVGGSDAAGLPPDEHALAVLDVNLLGAWRASAAALPVLLKSRGRVVNVASGLAFVGLPFTAAYCASKSALAAYSSVLRLEYGGALQVTTIYPGYVRTAIHDGAGGDGQAPGLEGVFREERLEDAVRAMVRACLGRYSRDLTTTRRGAFELWLARHFRNAIETASAKRLHAAIAARGDAQSPIAQRLRERGVI